MKPPTPVPVLSVAHHTRRVGVALIRGCRNPGIFGVMTTACGKCDVCKANPSLVWLSGLAERAETLLDALALLIAAEDELHAAKAERDHLNTVPFTQAVAEVGLPYPPEGADIVERASFGESVYRPSKERVRAATEARAIASQQARAALASVRSPRTTFQWLIERGQAHNQEPTLWLCSRAASTAMYAYERTPNAWTEIARHAWMFPTKAEAETYMLDNNIPHARVVEHGFSG